MAKRKRTKWHINLQNITQTIKDWATRTPLKFGGEFGCVGKVNSSFSTSHTRHATFIKYPAVSHECGKDGIDYDKRNISVVICDTDIS